MMMTVTATVAMLGLFTLALMLAPIAGDETPVVEWQQVLPHLDTFASYEDMQRYFDHRNQRSLRHLDNPADDSYVEAFNRHNEQEVQRSKRSTDAKTLPKMPTLIRFEMADAVEPSDEVKDLIRHYRSRELQTPTIRQDTKSKAIVKRTPSNTARNQKTGAVKTKKHSTRTRRATIHQQQPSNFKVQFIPFDESDAREPDEQTKFIIKRMRALDIEKLSRDLPAPDLPSMTHVVTSTTKKPLFKRPKYQKQRKPKRSKRDAPEMIKFELADAKDPDPSLKTFMQPTIKQTRESKDLKVGDNAGSDQQITELKDDDQKSQASKRYFSYKESPNKVKKSISPLPHDVQHIISHLIKGNGHGKAFVKYIPAQQMDYNKLKLAYQAPKGGQAVYGHGGNAYVKYGPGPAKAEQVQVQIHSVPVVEKIRYVYTPVAVGEGAGQGGPGGGHGGQEGGYGGQEAAYGGHAGAYGGQDAGHGGQAYGGLEAGHGGQAYGGQEAGHGGQAYGGQEGGHVFVAAAAYGGQDEGHGGQGGGHGGQGGGHGGPVEEYGGISHGYVGLGAHATPAAGGYGGHGGQGAYAADHAAAAISHPIVVADGGAGQKPAEIHHAYAAELAEDGNGKAEANEAIKSIPPPQFKASKPDASLDGDVSVAPTVEQYAQVYTNNIQTQDFKLKLYSPEALLAKAQLEAKLKIEAINAENLKVAAQYGGGGGHGGGGGGGGGGGHGGGGGGGHGGGGGGGHGGGGAYVGGGGGHAGGGAYVGGGGHGGGGGGGHGGVGAYGGGGGHGGGGGGHGGGGAYVGGGGHGGGGGGHGGGGAYVAGGGHGGVGGGHGGAGAYVGGGGHGGAGAYVGGGGHGGGGGGGGHGGAGAYVGGGGHGGGGGGGGHGGNANGPVIKIEYHAAPDSLKENYKEMPEFKHLSSLVGKSPEDQIHGLTYLLAKEMQTRLHGGGGGGEGGAGRPQDNKSPVLFHPEESGEAAGGHGGGGGGSGESAGHYQNAIIQPGKLIGMAKSKQYIPVIEQYPVDEHKAAAAALAIAGKEGGGGGGGGAGKGGIGGKYAAPHSYMSYGLSPNYKGFSLPAAQQKGGGGGYLGSGGAGKGLHEAGYDSAIQKLQSYASKYAFGYRIRDFNTGNDFGHKQNRDLNGVTRGQYHILLPDGRIQNVVYHADDTGFHADVSFEGTERPAVI